MAGCRSKMRIVGIAAALASVAFAGQMGLARGQRPAVAAPAKTHAPAHAPKEPVSAATPTAAPSSTVIAVSGRGAASDAGLVEAKTLDGGTRVFKFSELDIEGRLKSPQLVYFLRRVRAEFAAGDLGHRSFLREMSETRKESTF